jgi:hypothetical protein
MECRSSRCITCNIAVTCFTVIFGVGPNWPTARRSYCALIIAADMNVPAIDQTWVFNRALPPRFRKPANVTGASRFIAPVRELLSETLMSLQKADDR